MNKPLPALLSNAFSCLCSSYPFPKAIGSELGDTEITCATAFDSGASVAFGGFTEASDLISGAGRVALLGLVSNDGTPLGMYELQTVESHTSVELCY